MSRPARSGPPPKPRIEFQPGEPVALGLDASGPVDAIALVQGDLVLASALRRRPRRGGMPLVGWIDALLRDVALEPQDIAALAVVRGPGSFTGLRVALAAAQGFARSLAVPAWGYSAELAWALADTPTAVMLDARRDEVYGAITEPGAGIPRTVLPMRLTTPRSFAETAAGRPGPMRFAGDGARLYASLLRDVLGDRARLPALDPAGPDVARLARDALRRLRDGEGADVASLQPAYLRGHDGLAMSAPHAPGSGAESA
jgi:tRNA threonylcarbamoyladenosine biosynthesis protein TsaB